MSSNFFLPLFFALLGAIWAEPPMILQPLTGFTVPITGDQVLHRFCEVRAASLSWKVNNTILHSQTIDNLRNMGFTFPNQGQDPSSVKREAVIIDISPNYMNNNSVIYCIGHSADYTLQINSSATLIIADVPLPPHPVLSIRDTHVISASWEAPFSWRDFPITNYTVTMQLSNDEQRTVVLNSDTLSYNITIDDLASSCMNIILSVYATSEVGTSEPGITYMALPAAPGNFVDTPKTIITFDKRGVPTVEISFILPSVCPNNFATYLLRIKDQDNKVVYTDGPHVMSWTASGSRVTMTIRQSGLTRNAKYSAELNVGTSGGQVSTTFNIDTEQGKGIAMTSGIPLRGPATDNSFHLVLGAAIGGFSLILLLVTIALITVILCWRRKLKHRRREYSEDVLKKTTSMTTNPIYTEHCGAIYEEIPGMKGVTPERDEGYTSVSSTPIPTRNSPSTGKDGNSKDHSYEDAYTVMNSIGTVIPQLPVDATVDLSSDRSGRHENQYNFK